MKIHRLQHVFVGYIPEKLDPGKLYISLEYATANHKCCCGCGREVVTPFSPRDWQMTFDGESVSLSPSIGNWQFPCESHYFIRKGLVVEAESWKDEYDKITIPKRKHRMREYLIGEVRQLWNRLFSR